MGGGAGGGGGGMGGGMGMNRGMPYNMRIPKQPGDWDCPQCGNMNFARRTQCNGECRMIKNKYLESEVLKISLTPQFKVRVAPARWRSVQSLSDVAPREVPRIGGLETGTVGGVAT